MSDWVLPKRQGQREEPVAPLELDYDYVLPRRTSVQKTEEPASIESQTLAEYPWYDRALIGMGSRVDDMGLGLRQASGFLTGDQDAAEQVAREFAEKDPFRRAISKDTAAIAGGVGADLGVALPMAGLGRALTTVPGLSAFGSALSSPIIGSGIAGGVLGGPLTPQLFADPNYMLEGSVQGTGLGLLGGLLTQGAMSTLGRTKNAMTGRFADPASAERLAAFDEWGVPGSLGDISQKPLTMYGENLAQYAPFSGREAFLHAQSQALKDAIASAPTKIAGAVPSNSKEDIGKGIADSIKARYKELKQQAGQMYDQVETLAATRGAPDVNPFELASTARRLQQEYPGFFDAFQDSKAVRRLNDIIKDTGPQNSPILQASGQPFQHPPAVPFSEMRWLDKRLGSMMRQADKQVFAGKMDPEAFKQFTQLQQALRADIDNWAAGSGIPEVATGIQEASRFFRQNVVPFRENPITAKVIKDRADFDKLPGQLLKLDAPALTEKAVSFLTPEGQQLAKHFMLQTAEKRAMDEALNPMLGFFRSQSDTVLGESGPKLFSAEELAKLKSLESVIHGSKRAVRLASDPSESARLLGLAALTNPSLPITAKLFTATGQHGGLTKFILADPKLSQGVGLGSILEESMRRSGAGLGGLLEMTDHDILSSEF